MGWVLPLAVTLEAFNGFAPNRSKALVLGVLPRPRRSQKLASCRSAASKAQLGCPGAGNRAQ